MLQLQRGSVCSVSAAEYLDLSAVPVVFQTELRTLPIGFGALFGSDTGLDTESAIRERAKSYSSDLKQRASQELPVLPFKRSVLAALSCC